MAIFVPEVAAPYLMKEIDKRLVISNAALDISADVPELAWKGSEITFPVYSRVAVASAVTAKGSVTPTEIDGSSSTAAIKHFAAAVKYHKDTLRQSGGPRRTPNRRSNVYAGAVFARAGLPRRAAQGFTAQGFYFQRRNL